MVHGCIYTSCVCTCAWSRSTRLLLSTIPLKSRAPAYTVNNVTCLDHYQVPYYSTKALEGTRPSMHVIKKRPPKVIRYISNYSSHRPTSERGAINNNNTRNFLFRFVWLVFRSFHPIRSRFHGPLHHPSPPPPDPYAKCNVIANGTQLLPKEGSMNGDP